MSDKFSGQSRSAISNNLRIGVSAAALSAAMMSAPAYAQTDGADDGPDDEIVVTGIRSSLQSAQQMKREADVFVDAVSAQDIGALPDRSVSETLQRIPGVAITRFEGVNDPDHFTVEGAGAVVRGLNFVRSELNGRDAFAADDGQAIGFNDVSPELLGSVEVFKNQSADMIEGGLAGTINLNVRKPFDQPGHVIAFTAEANYTDLAEKWTPTVSGVLANRWDTNSGEFGILVGGSFSRLESRADSTLIADYIDRSGGSGQLTPAGAGIRTQEFDRERSTIAASAQWRSPDQTMEATFEFFRAAYNNSWGERAIEPSIDDGPGIIPRPGTSFSFDSDGLFESGIISESVGWRGPDPAWPLNGVRQLAVTRERIDESFSHDMGFNFKWAPQDNFRANLDLQYAKSDVNITDFTVHAATYADIFIDTTLGGEIPAVGYVVPTGAPTPYYSDPNNYYLRSAMDHLSRNDGEEYAARLDMEYDFSGDSWAKSVRFGARFAQRDQVVRSSTFNWGNISEQWNGGGVRLSDTSVIPAGTFAVSELDNYLRDPFSNTGLAGGVPFYAGPLATDYTGAAGALQTIAAAAGQRGWVPLSARSGVAPGTAFLPSEITDVEQRNIAAYVRLDFGSDEFLGGGLTIDGNVGVRYVRTNLGVLGAVNFPDGAATLAGQTVATFCTPAIPGAMPPTECRLGLPFANDYFQWADGSGAPRNADHSYDEWLPSLNVKIGLNEDQIIRFGYSRALSRPDFGLAKNDFNIQTGPTDTGTGAWFGPDVSTGNAFLNPITADQFDLSFEWYFADVGSLTVTGFYKILHDYITPFTTEVPFTNNGVTIDVDYNSSVNAPGSSSVRGFEVAYQQTFDNLPGVFSGLGVQANYTFVDSDGVPVESPVSSDRSGRSPTPPNFDVSGLPLPLLSKHNANLVGFYENEKFTARLAYNWRSEYILSVRDVIFPFTPIQHAATGQLDGSLFYNVSDSVKVGVQAVNLLNEVTKTRAIINAQLVEVPRAFSVNDRRYAFIVRGNF